MGLACPPSSLTPALSRRERENRSPLVGKRVYRWPSDRLDMAADGHGLSNGREIDFAKRYVSFPLSLRERAGVRDDGGKRSDSQASHRSEILAALDAPPRVRVPACFQLSSL